MRAAILLAMLVVSVLNGYSQEKESGFQYNNDLDFYYSLPQHYNLAENETKLFPLVIYLHGGGGRGKIGGLDFLGYSDEAFQSTYPSFVLVPQSDRGWNPGKINPLIEKFVSEYPVDTRRIYLIGYSMGGSGSYIIANGLYDYNQTLFAGIIRLAGQSQTTLRDPIALNTSVWMHIGLDDTPLRVDITREAYGFLKENHPNSDESAEKVEINGISGTTFTLEGKGSSQVKLTEYDGVGHGIFRFPFDDRGLMSWLFQQHLE